MGIKERTTSELDAFSNADARDAPIPSLDDFLGSHAVGKLVKDLPNHDPCAFQSRFAVANLGICNNVLSEFDTARYAFGRPLGVLHPAIVSARAEAFKAFSFLIDVPRAARRHPRTTTITVSPGPPQAAASSHAETLARTAESDPAAVFEYATLRWAGRENRHLIRPGGNVDFIGTQLLRFKKPDRADERSFYMNIALNALAKEGYELIAMTPDDYVLRRRAPKP